MITDKMINDGAIALALSELTEKGRKEFNFEKMFSLQERQDFRAKASIVLHAALNIAKENVIKLK